MFLMQLLIRVRGQEGGVPVDQICIPLINGGQGRPPSYSRIIFRNHNNKAGVNFLQGTKKIPFNERNLNNHLERMYSAISEYTE
ncbi:MAG: hypothetical protein P9L92_13880 [Candidatus Electryonea clarkiae]|nr:hypothetical protein [Candidatus Electryonea clarkiae]